MDSQLPAVLPHQWVKLGMNDLVDILRLQWERIPIQYNREYIRLIKEDHKDMKKAVHFFTIAAEAGHPKANFKRCALVGSEVIHPCACSTPGDPHH